MEKSTWYLKALVDAENGRSCFRGRDTNGKLPVEIAMEHDLGLETVPGHVLLGQRKDMAVQTDTEGPHAYEAKSVLIWAIQTGHPTICRISAQCES